MKQFIKDQIAIKLVSRGKKREFSFTGLESKHCEKDIKAFNDSSYFAGISKEGYSFVTRMSFRVDKPNENWLMINIPGEGVYGFENLSLKEGRGFKQGDLEYICIEPAKKWRLLYNGTINNHGLRLDLNWDASSPIVVFDKTGTSAKQVGKQIAKEKWTKGFFKKLRELDQVHYEQAGIISGTFQWKGIARNLSFVGIRDHSWGVRNWEDWDRHFWILGLLDDGRFFNFSLISYGFVKNLQAAFIFDKTNYKTIYKIPYFDEIQMDSLMPKELSFDVMEEKGGKKKLMTLEMKDFFPFQMDNNYYLRQARSNFMYDGVKGVGIAEMGVNLKNYEIDVDSTY
ncbi:MAG: hypothetical protein GXO88_11985 [Chlorobi bacterium]|nr:hypothetical protein [Chlorobiota bacterium]